MKLFGRGRSARPEIRLRRAVERAGHPIVHRVPALVDPFGHASATPEVLEEVSASLASVGLTTNPPLVEADVDAVIEVLISEPAPAEATPPSVEPDVPDEQIWERRCAELEAELAALHQDRAEQAAILEDIQQARLEAEALATEARQEAESSAAELAHAERRIDEELEQRLAAISESQETLRREREQAESNVQEARAERDRLEAELADAIEQRDNEISKAERGESRASSLLEESRAETAAERERRIALESRLQSIVGATQHESGETSTSGGEPVTREPAATPTPEMPLSAGPDLESTTQEPSATEASNARPGSTPAEARIPAFHQPPQAGSRGPLARIRRGRKAAKRPAARYRCGVTGLEAPADSEWELRRAGWIISGSNALSPEAQADGWQFPEGAAMPFRLLSRR